MKKIINVLPIQAVVLGSVSTLATSFAHTVEAQNESFQLEEIVVTAQRREESLQDVPISVSAFTAQSMDRADIGEASEYLTMTPNVGFSESGEGGSRSVNIAIRGVSNLTIDGVASANSIGYYVDDLSVGSVAQGTINPQLQDMERIEVLRGPQGTYFGRNAVGGAINISTKKPSADPYLEASIGAERFGGRSVEVIGNMPLSDTFMVRGVVGYEESDTPVRNVNPLGTQPFYEHYNGRFSFRYLPSNDTTVDFSLTLTEEDEGGDIAVGSGVVDLDTGAIFGVGPDGSLDTAGIGFFPGNRTRIDRDTKEFNNKDFAIANLRINHDIGNMTLRSITGYIDSSFDRHADLDGTSELLPFAPAVLRRVNNYEGESFSQELRLQSVDGEGIDWTVGLFYAKDELEQRNDIQVLDASARSGDPLFSINRNINVQEFETAAIFADTTWFFSEHWSLGVGARWSYDEVFASQVDFNRGPVPLKDEVSDTDFSPRVVLNYSPSEDLNYYASISRAYKAGGTDVTGESRTEGAPYDPEELISYELGFKSTLADGRVRLNGAVFSMVWEDFQVQTNRLEDPTDISSAISTTQNADKASATGLELELTALLTEGLTLSANVGYLDSEYDDYPDATLRGETNGLPNVVNISGQPLVRAPELTSTISLEYDFELSSGWNGFVLGSWSYVDDQFSNIEALGSQVGETVNGDTFNLPTFPYQIPSYDIFNLSAGVSHGRLSISAWVKNLFDENYYTGTSDSFGLAGIRIYPHFREYGVKFTYRFND